MEIAGGWASAVAALASRLVDAERRAALANCLDANRISSIPLSPAQVVIALALWLLPDLMPRALALVRERMHYAYEQADAIGALLPHLPNELLNDAVEIVNWLGLGNDEAALAKAAAALASRLADEERRAVLEKALTMVRASNNPEQRARSLVALAPGLADEERRAVLAEAVEMARAIDEPLWRIRALVALAPRSSQVERRGLLADRVRGTCARRSGSMAVRG